MTKDAGKWLDDAGPRTRAIRAGIRRTGEAEHAEPIFTSSSFLFDSPEDAAAKFAGEVDGNVYSRYTNPTVRSFEERLAALEQGDAAVAGYCRVHGQLGDVGLAVAQPGDGRGQIAYRKTVDAKTTDIGGDFDDAVFGQVANVALVGDVER